MKYLAEFVTLSLFLTILLGVSKMWNTHTLTQLFHFQLLSTLRLNRCRWHTEVNCNNEGEIKVYVRTVRINVTGIEIVILLFFCSPQKLVYSPCFNYENKLFTLGTLGRSLAFISEPGKWHLVGKTTLV